MRIILVCGVLVVGLACGCSDDGPDDGEGKGGPAETPPTPPTQPAPNYIDRTSYKGQAAVHAKSLQKTLRALDRDIRNESIEVRRKALRSILPAKADIQAIVPAHAEKLWTMMGPSRDRMVERVDQVAADLTRDKWIEIDAIDIRQETSSRRYQAVAKVIPDSIPAFRVIKHGRTDTAGSSTYLYVNDHWIHLPEIEKFAGAIVAMDKAKDAAKKPKEE